MDWDFFDLDEYDENENDEQNEQDIFGDENVYSTTTQPNMRKIMYFR